MEGFPVMEAAKRANLAIGRITQAEFDDWYVRQNDARVYRLEEIAQLRKWIELKEADRDSRNQRIESQARDREAEIKRLEGRVKDLEHQLDQAKLKQWRHQDAEVKARENFKTCSRMRHNDIAKWKERVDTEIFKARLVLESSVASGDTLPPLVAAFLKQLVRKKSAHTTYEKVVVEDGLKFVAHLEKLKTES